jgi:hypothetical protein
MGSNTGGSDNDRDVNDDDTYDTLGGYLYSKGDEGGYGTERCDPYGGGREDIYGVGGDC